MQALPKYVRGQRGDSSTAHKWSSEETRLSRVTRRRISFLKSGDDGSWEIRARVSGASQR